MSRFISMEDLIANALIESIDNFGVRKISFETVMKYGRETERYLTDRNNNATLLASKEYKNNAISDNPDFFKLSVKDGDEFIELKDGKSVSDLKKHFRTFLSTELMFAFMSDEAVGILTA